MRLIAAWLLRWLKGRKEQVKGGERQMGNWRWNEERKVKVKMAWSKTAPWKRKWEENKISFVSLFLPNLISLLLNFSCLLAKLMPPSPCSIAHFYSQTKYFLTLKKDNSWNKRIKWNRYT
jgi:hypothetical protein